MEENNKNKNYEFVLLERLENKIDAIVEGQKITDEKVDGIAQDVESLKEDMDYVKSEVVDIRARIKEMDVEVKEIKSDVTEIKGDIKEINGKLDRKADKETVDGHETRIIKLESNVLATA